jgi:hypothetical protein
MRSNCGTDVSIRFLARQGVVHTGTDLLRRTLSLLSAFQTRALAAGMVRVTVPRGGIEARLPLRSPWMG